MTGRTMSVQIFKTGKLLLSGSAGLIVFVLLLSTCKQSDLFPEYRGTNLISGIALAKWAADQGTVYMNYEQVSGTGYEPPTGHDSADVYRLEIKNLVPNGDFENSTVGSAPSGWVLYPGGGADTLKIVDSGSGEIYDKTMHLKIKTLDRVDFNVRDTVNGAIDGFSENNSYLVRFNYRTAGALVFELNDTATSLGWLKFFGGENGGKINITIANLLEYPPAELKGLFPDETVGSASAYYFSFGSVDSGNSSPQEGYIDNFRLIRTDLKYRLRLLLSYADDASEPLISGSYRFSVYVKRDPSAGTDNRFTSNRIDLGITGGGVSSNGTGFDESSFSSYKQFYDGEDGQDWSDWSQVYVDLTLQIPNSSSRAMEVSICPTDDSQGSLYLDAGSILVSVPGLELFPDGFP